MPSHSNDREMTCMKCSVFWIKQEIFQRASEILGKYIFPILPRKHIRRF